MDAANSGGTGAATTSPHSGSSKKSSQPASAGWANPKVQTTRERVSWDTSMATGIPEVDRQHQRLIAELGRLIDALHQGQARHEIKAILDFLVEYVETHFGFEEDCMARYQCPAAASNKAAHAQFMQIFESFLAEFEANGASSMLAIKVEHELLDWLTTHIRGIDGHLQSCAAQFRAAPDSKSLSRLKR